MLQRIFLLQLMKNYKYILRLIVGIIFLISSLAKAIAAGSFSNLLLSYGVPFISYLAPIIIVFEAIVALLLIFDIKPRITTIITLSFIVVATAVFTYGLSFKGITDCGCFGNISFLNQKPWLTFLRNAILVVMLLPSLTTNLEENQLTTSVIIYITAIVCVVCFMCGFTFRSANILNSGSREPDKQLLADHPLNDFIKVDKDSTYLIFAFSYSCQHCINSVNNVNQYERVGAVDKVIGLALEDSVAQDYFEQYFDLTFEVRNMPLSELSKVTNTFPTAFYLKGDTITNIITGYVPNPVLLIGR